MSSGRTAIFLYGAGGHGGSVLEVIDRQAVYQVAAVLDDSPTGTSFRGVSMIGGRETLASLAGQGLREGFVAVGDNVDRERLTSLVLEEGLTLVTVIDPSAQIARYVPVGSGTVVMPCVAINAGAVIGANVILNTSCSVDHDTVVHDYAHLAPGVHVSGACELGARCQVGIGASIVQGVRIGERARIGAGAAVIDDVPADVLAVGVPARHVELQAASEGSA